MLDYFVYASISSGKKIDDGDTILENSKIYRKTKSIEENIAFLYVIPEANASRDSFNYDITNPSGTMFVDILMNRDKRHRKLDKIIEYVKNNYENRGFIIVVQSISVFGTISQIQYYYQEFLKNNIYVLCVDYSRFSGLSEYSTSDFRFEKRDKEEFDRAYKLICNLKPDAKELNNRGAVAHFSKAFIESYWKYETYKVPEEIAVLASGIGRSAFHRKCALYEYSNEFKWKIDDLSKEELSTLVRLPKRFSKFPEKFDELKHEIDKIKWSGNLSYKNNEDRENIEKIFDDACIGLQIPSIHPINYQRLKIRQAVGRKEIAAEYKNYDKNIIAKFMEYSLNPENSLDKFWDKYKNNEL